MALNPAYCSGIAGGPTITIEISQAGLRSLLRQIEADLYQSEAYSRALAGLQTMLGEATEGAQVLVKAVGREAIRLALKQFAKQHQATSTSQATKAVSKQVQPLPVTSDSSVATVSAKKPLVPASAQPDSLTTEPDTSEVNLESNLTSPSGLASTPSAVIVDPDLLSPQGDNGFESRLLGDTKPKKLTKAELEVQMADQEREARLRQLGEELRQAREAQSLTLDQLHKQTLVPLYHLKALETGGIERLPEDIYVRGFIRRIGNALGLDSAQLVASLPAPDPVKAVLPSWYHPEVESGAYLRPVHLYLGYAALMAGAVGGLHWLSQHSAPGAATAPDQPISPQAAVSQSARSVGAIYKPGLKFNQAGVVAGSDIAPPEAFSD